MIMLEPRFATEKSKRNLLRVMPEIDAGLERRSIPNARLEECRFLISNAYDSERSEVTRWHYAEVEAAGIRMWDTRKAIAFDLIPYSLMSCGAIRKRTLKLRAEARDDDVFRRIADDADAFLARWEPVAEAMKTLKSVAVKGRQKLPESERKTPERTIEHTGTCACCVRNVKLSDDDKIVDHGFQLAWHTRRGRCEGVGHPPVEISPAGINALIVLIETNIENLNQAINDLESGKRTTLIEPGSHEAVKIGDPGWDRLKAYHLDGWRYDLSRARQILDHERQRFAEWVPTPLPDGRADHMPDTEESPAP